MVSTFMSGCALREDIGVAERDATVGKIAALPRSSNDSSVVVRGYYRPSYEGSVLCQTREFENCLLLVLSEEDYKKYAGNLGKGDFVTVIGRFRWVDIEGMRKDFEKSNVVAPFYPYHRIVDVNSITLAD